MWPDLASSHRCVRYERSLIRERLVAASRNWPRCALKSGYLVSCQYGVRPPADDTSPHAPNHALRELPHLSSGCAASLRAHYDR